jgi:hypothetical protein
MQELVPVKVGKSIQHGKGIVLWRTILSLKRLLPPNECLVLRRESADSPENRRLEVIPVIAEILSPEKDREFHLIVDDLAILFRQVADEIVEDGSEVVQDFANLEAAHWPSESCSRARTRNL